MAERDASAEGGESGVRARTRLAILEAAVEALSREPGASLGDIAAEAGVGRTTLHRYFSERSQLITAVGELAAERIEEASARARIEEGPGIDALERLCVELLEIGDTLVVIFNQPQIASDPAWQSHHEADEPLSRLVERGHADGTIDPALSPKWVEDVLWAMLYVCCDQIRLRVAPRHEVTATCLRTLRKAAGTAHGP